MVVGSGIPTCTRLGDTITISATSILSPTIRAVAQTQVQPEPDPATCPTADVAIGQAASDDSIASGETVTFTLTVTNVEAAPVTVIVTDTLTPAGAVGDVSLPAGCEREGAEVSCAGIALEGSGSEVLTVSVQTRPGFAGILRSYAQLGPEQALDRHMLDNAALPAEVEVVWEGGILRLPLIVRTTAG
jgi:uncharacterized repeat protein (TIGR01451 family)